MPLNEANVATLLNHYAGKDAQLVSLGKVIMGMVEMLNATEKRLAEQQKAIDAVKIKLGA